jgi:hypothetical protein
MKISTRSCCTSRARDRWSRILRHDDILQAFSACGISLTLRAGLSSKTVRTFPSFFGADSLHIAYRRELRGRHALTLLTALHPSASLRTLTVLIYLFRDERTDDRALTMDVTGRNIPLVAASTVWLFVEAIDTHSLPPQWDTAYLRYAVRQVGMTGFYLLEPGPMLPPSRTC